MDESDGMSYSADIFQALGRHDIAANLRWSETRWAEESNVLDVLDQVRLIHARNKRFPYYCVNCRSPLPCTTIRALDEWNGVRP